MTRVLGRLLDIYSMKNWIQQMNTQLVSLRRQMSWSGKKEIVLILVLCFAPSSSVSGMMPTYVSESLLEPSPPATKPSSRTQNQLKSKNEKTMK